MTNLKVFILSFALVFAIGLIATAQETPPAGEVTEMIALDENVQPENLEISEPRLLPDNPFYFLKNWARGIQSLVTINPVKKAGLKMKFANEKVMEVKKIAQKTENPEIIKKAVENYQRETEKIKNQVDKIKEKAEKNPQVESFLDKFINQQILHQKLLQKLETQVSSQAFEKIKEVKEEHLERFQDVMLKLEDREEKITEKLDKILENQKGSQFKEFGNLEILKNLEEKVPEKAKEAIKRVQENTFKKLQDNLEKMNPENQEKFGEYIEKISGEEEKHLEILENLRSEIKAAPATPEIIKLKAQLEEGKAGILEGIGKKLEKLDCPQWVSSAPDFCKEGRVIMKKDPKTGCLLPPKCIVPGEVECQTLVTCQEGYTPRATGKRDSQGCPIIECLKEKEGEKPAIACITLWDPVCGKDGRTYSNGCFAKVAGVEAAHEGVCQNEQTEILPKIQEKIKEPIAVPLSPTEAAPPTGVTP